MDQLFNAGQVKVTYSRRPSTRQTSDWKKLKISRLVGDGKVRQDPSTGRWYELNGTTTFKRAYPATCDECGTDFHASSRRQRRIFQTFGCSLCFKCAETMGGELNAKPVGTKKVSAQGYVIIRTHDGWAREHRVVMEEQLGRSLRSEETVHHIDGDRSNNHPPNLQLRHGNHGSGQALRCAECGSHDIEPIPLEGGVASPSRIGDRPKPFANLPFTESRRGPGPQPMVA